MPINKYSRLAIRRDTKANLKTVNPLLREGEPCAEIDTGRLKIGDGKKRWNKLKYVGGGSSASLSASIKINGETIFEKGTEIDNVNVSYSFSGEPDLVTISSYNYTKVMDMPEITSGTLTVTGPFNMNTNNSIKIKAETDELSKEDSKSLNFYSRIYYAVSNNNVPNTDSLNSMLIGKLTTDPTNNPVTISRLDLNGENDYAYVFIPLSLINNKKLKFYIDVNGSVMPWSGGMLIESKQNVFEDSEAVDYSNIEDECIINIANSSDYSEKFYIYRTNQCNLGNISIRIVSTT